MPDQSSAASEHALLQEITAPLETLPDDPLSLVEADFPTAMRGYDRHAVDDYVEQVSRLVSELHATRSPEAAVRRALERVGDQISGVLQRAHETAEQITAQSRTEAEDRLERARREAASLIEAAERRVRELDADTDRVWAERQRIVADAEALSGQLLAVAQDAAARFPVEETRPFPVTDYTPEPFEADEPEAVADEQASAEQQDPPVEDPAAEDPAAEDLAGQSPAPEDPAPEDPGAPSPPAENLAGEGSAGEDPTEPIDPTERIAWLSEDDSTRVIPPSSDAAQRRRES
jgi:DivIVA domain-containing protein